MQHWFVPAVAIGIMIVIAVMFARGFWTEGRRADARLIVLEERAGIRQPPPPLATPTQPGGVEFTKQEAAALWDEWVKTLILENRRGQHVTRRTIDAEDFFTQERIAPGFTNFRVLGLAPSFFTGLGVLATFVGLALGISGVDLDAGQDTSSIINSVSVVVGAAGFAFFASLAGVLLSLGFNLWEKIAERRLLSRLAILQATLNAGYALVTPDHSLVQILEYERESKEALQELHERIGDRLQEAMAQHAEATRDALATSISESLAPAMQTLVTATTTQSSQVFESLVERFASAFTDLGNQQRVAMDDAAARLQQAVERLENNITAASQQQLELLVALESAGESMETSSSRLENAGATLDRVSDRFQETSDALGSNLTESTTTLGSIFGQLEAQSEAGQSLTRDAIALAERLNISTDALTASSATVASELERFSLTQQSFREDMIGNAKALADELQAHVRGLATQVESWLGAYSADVEAQIVDRMQTWNTVSQDYAAKMLATAHALSEVVEEISERQPRAVSGTVA